MKRDWNVIEKILTDLEADKTIEEIVKDDKRILYHIQMLQYENCIDGVWRKDGYERTPILTMKGYDLLEYLRAFKHYEKSCEEHNIPKTIDTMKALFKEKTKDVAALYL